ncbi:hypothetical protein EH196_07125 [Bacillus sp. C1-1]|nr:hypothetical protein EH196_07125 [Bacillus sp. C1-1]
MCELWRNGYNAIQSSDPQQQDWDILILDQANTIVTTKIQVKTMDWNKKGVITGNFDAEFDYLAIVVLNFPNRDYVHCLVPKNKLVKRNVKLQPRGLFTEDNSINYTKRTITIKVEDFVEKLIDKYSFREFLENGSI